MTILHEYHDITTTIWPMQSPRHDTTPPTQLKPPISRAGQRQIGRLAKLRNECNHTTKHHPETPNNADLNPIHINLKITQILKPTTPLITIETQHQCSRNIGTIKKTAKSEIKKTRVMTKAPNTTTTTLRYTRG
jgi:hypothetical protein